MRYARVLDWHGSLMEATVLVRRSRERSGMMARQRTFCTARRSAELALSLAAGRILFLREDVGCSANS